MPILAVMIDLYCCHSAARLLISILHPDHVSSYFINDGHTADVTPAAEAVKISSTILHMSVTVQTWTNQIIHVLHKPTTGLNQMPYAICFSSYWRCADPFGLALITHYVRQNYRQRCVCCASYHVLTGYSHEEKGD